MVGILEAEIGSRLANVGWARTTVATAENQYEKWKDGDPSHNNRMMDSTVRDRLPNELAGCAHWRES